MAIQWNDRYATGIPEVDEQHRKLFAMLDDLEQRLSRNEPATRLAEFLTRFKRYSVDHFSWEEACMDRTACSMACANRMAHQRFMRVLNRAQAEHIANPASHEVFVALYREGEIWLKEHICAIDVKLKHHVGAARPA